jgi:hypothetical protein
MFNQQLMKAIVIQNIFILYISIHLDLDFLSKFPLNDYAMYLDVKDLTLNDFSFKIKLVRIFYSILQHYKINH